MKLPAIQFYPADWRKDPGVQSLSFHDRGIWFEILCLMHESDQRGKLLLNGKPMPDEALSRLLGLDKQVLTKAITSLLEYGVASRDEETGALVCRRMIRDDQLRQTRKTCGKLGGNPALLNQKSTTRLNQKSTPSSSSSASAKEEEEEEEKAPANLLALELDHQEPAAPVWTKAGWQGIGATHKARWGIAYPACNIDRQLAQMDNWLRANPAEASKSNWLRFITNWLKREQDKGGDKRSERQGQPVRSERRATFA